MINDNLSAERVGLEEGFGLGKDVEECAYADNQYMLELECHSEHGQNYFSPSVGSFLQKERQRVKYLWDDRANLIERYEWSFLKEKGILREVDYAIICLNNAHKMVCEIICEENPGKKSLKVNPWRI